MAMDFFSPIIDDKNDQKIPCFFDIRNTSDTSFSGFAGPGIALITVDSFFSQNVRKNTDLLQNHFKNITLYDLGNLNHPDTESVKKVIDFLQTMDIIPVFIGLGLETVKSLASACDSSLYQVANSFNGATASEYTYNYLAFQRHLCALNDIFTVDEYLYNSLSLGKIRSYPSLLEPVMRDMQMLYTDLNSIRRSDVPNITDSLPTGLHAEELCQLMKYSGTAHDIQAIFFNDVKTTQDHISESLLMAEALWYFIEGLNMSVREHPSVSSDFSEFVVYSSAYDNDLVFKRNNQTLKWWLADQSMSDKISYLACAYEEYEMVSGGEEIPERLLKFLNHASEKMNPV